MYKVLKKYRVGNKYCVSVEGESKLLRNGINLRDEKGNLFTIESIGMVKYEDIKDYKKYAEMVLMGEVENIGEILNIVE